MIDEKRDAVGDHCVLTHICLWLPAVPTHFPTRPMHNSGALTSSDLYGGAPWSLMDQNMVSIQLSPMCIQSLLTRLLRESCFYIRDFLWKCSQEVFLTLNAKLAVRYISVQMSCMCKFMNLVYQFTDMLKRKK